MSESVEYRIRPMTVDTVHDDIRNGFVEEMQRFMPSIVANLPEDIAKGHVSMLVAEGLDGTPIGHIGIGWLGSMNKLISPITGDRINLAFLGVREQYQGHGIGTNLVLNAIATVLQDERGRRGICLTVEEGNTSRGIYDRLGFIPQGELVPGRGDAMLQAMIWDQGIHGSQTSFEP